MGRQDADPHNLGQVQQEGEGRDQQRQEKDAAAQDGSRFLGMPGNQIENECRTKCRKEGGEEYLDLSNGDFRLVGRVQGHAHRSQAPHGEDAPFGLVDGFLFECVQQGQQKDKG